MDIVERLFVLIQRFPTEDPAPGLKCFVADTEAYAYPCREEVEIVERIFDQVLGTFPKAQHLDGFTGCVAVANRNHRDHAHLVEVYNKTLKHMLAHAGTKLRLWRGSLTGS